MKQVVGSLLALAALLVSCKPAGSMNAIQPKAGSIEVPANGEFRIWRDTMHPSFTVTLSNPSGTQSCEVYRVTDTGNEKWVNPSLIAGKSLTVKVPSNGHLFFKNFNPNVFTLTYRVSE